MTTKIHNKTKVDTCTTKCKSACKCKGKTKKSRRKSSTLTTDGGAPKRYMTNAVGGGNALVRDNAVVLIGNREPNPEGNTRALQMYKETYDRAIEYQQRNFELTLNAMRKTPPPQREAEVQTAPSVSDASVQHKPPSAETASQASTSKANAETQYMYEADEKEQAEGSAIKSHQCPKCNLLLANNSNLQRHIKSQHPDFDIATYNHTQRRSKAKK